MFVSAHCHSKASGTPDPSNEWSSLHIKSTKYDVLGVKDGNSDRFSIHPFTPRIANDNLQLRAERYA